MQRYTKAEAIMIVIQCAQLYKKELEGKNLLFICTDKHKNIIPIEFSFRGFNFLHLTGLKTPKRENEKLIADDFYRKCLNRKLSANDFDFSEDGTTHMKLEVLPSILTKNLQAKMIGNYNSSKPFLYTEKIAGSTNACMGFVWNETFQAYVPNTVLRDDIRNLAVKTLRVIAAYRKEIAASQYEELTYIAKKVDLSQIDFPEEFAYLKPANT